MNDEEIREFALQTLDQMASGGIYDQIGGGFARYSTDEKWKVPHFEKMLYDNAQLVSLYAQAFRLSGKGRYKDVVYQTLDYIQESMTSSVGLFYSALDADSEGVEGLFYTWNKEELQDLLGVDYPLAESYYGIGAEGAWEDERNILLRPERTGWKETAKEDIQRINEKLKEARTLRIPPGPGRQITDVMECTDDQRLYRSLPDMERASFPGKCRKGCRFHFGASDDRRWRPLSCF